MPSSGMSISRFAPSSLDKTAVEHDDGIPLSVTWAGPGRESPTLKSKGQPTSEAVVLPTVALHMHGAVTPLTPLRQTITHNYGRSRAYTVSPTTPGQIRTRTILSCTSCRSSRLFPDTMMTTTSVSFDRNWEETLPAARKAKSQQQEFAQIPRQERQQLVASLVAFYGRFKPHAGGAVPGNGPAPSNSRTHARTMMANFSVQDIAARLQSEHGCVPDRWTKFLLPNSA